MRSQLTRSVFQRLLLNEGIIFPCPTRLTLRSRPRSACHASSILRCSQRRTFFGISSAPPPRKPKAPDVDPGLKEMIEFTKSQKLGLRPAPVHDLARAWNQFFAYKHTTKTQVNSLQAINAMRLLEYLQDLKEHTGSFILNSRQLGEALTTIGNARPNYVDLEHVQLAKAVHAQLEKRNECNIGITTTRRMAKILCIYGETSAAKELAESKGELHDPTILLYLVKGYSRERDAAKLIELSELVDEFGGKVTRRQLLTGMVTLHAERNDIEGTKKWVSKLQEQCKARNIADTILSAVLKFSLRTGELEWCKEFFRTIIDANPRKNQWDVVLQWASGAVGKGVEDVERMMGIMSKQEDCMPDIETINGLVELAISFKDPYLAERYLALGLKNGIYPNAKTHLLQMNYRLDAGDLTGAQAAYNSLQSEENTNDDDLPVINRFLRVLCSKPNTYNQIISMVSDLDARKARLEPDTTSALAMMYMERDDTQDVFDLLQDHSYHYTFEERRQIRDKFVEYCLDRRNDTTRAWDAYQVIKQIFDETNVEVRTRLMNEFFDRGRSDMASYVFGHMRQHELQKPTLETYIACFEGIARCEDEEALDMVHNMFKLDSAMEPNTKLYNALMLAYTSTDSGDRALDFWDDITNSSEGPSYRSLEVVFRACQIAPFGGQPAREIWSKMRRMEIEITKEVWQAYIGCLAGKGKFDEAREMVEGGEKEFGIRPDFLTLGIFYNAMPGQNRKDMIEAWGKATFPEEWAELEKVGQTTIDGGFVKKFLIQLEWKA